MNYKTIKTNKAITLLLCVLLFITGLFFAMPTASTYADKIEYTDVVSDLLRDGNFNSADYPVNSNEYSIQVIQIAESTNNELFIYTYQPQAGNRHLTASKLALSISNDNPEFRLYGLTLLSRNNVFCKYKVNDFSVSFDTARYYTISEILRDWIEVFDDELDNDNTLNYVSYAVGQCWLAATIDGVVTYSLTIVETIKITDMWCGTFRYPNGLTMENGIIRNTSCDSHFVAFSTDHDIEKLISADVSFTYKELHVGSVFGGSKKTWSNSKNKFLTLTYSDKGGNIEGPFTDKYEWKRIQSVISFKKAEQSKLTDATKENLKGKQWILRFWETSYTEGVNFWQSLSGYYSETKVDNVAILRLAYDLNGTVYNLGVVGNVQSADNVIDNVPPKSGFWEKLIEFFKSLWNKIVSFFADNWYWVLIVVAVIVILIFLPVVGPVIKSGFKLMGKALKHIGKALLWLITAPFRFVKWIVEKIRERKGGAA